MNLYITCSAVNDVLHAKLHKSLCNQRSWFFLILAGWHEDEPDIVFDTLIDVRVAEHTVQVKGGATF